MNTSARRFGPVASRRSMSAVATSVFDAVPKKNADEIRIARRSIVRPTGQGAKASLIPPCHRRLPCLSIRSAIATSAAGGQLPSHRPLHSPTLKRLQSAVMARSIPSAVPDRFLNNVAWQPEWSKWTGAAIPADRVAQSANACLRFVGHGVACGYLRSPSAQQGIPCYLLK